MCKCLDPVRHSCGEFCQFIAIRGDRDVYRCGRCGVDFSVRCHLEEFGLEMNGGNDDVESKAVR